MKFRKVQGLADDASRPELLFLLFIFLTLIVILNACTKGPVGPDPVAASPSPVASPTPPPGPVVIGAGMTARVQGSGEGDNQTTFHVNNTMTLSLFYKCAAPIPAGFTCPEVQTGFWHEPSYPCKLQGSQGNQTNELKCEFPTDVIVGADVPVPGGSAGETFYAEYRGTAIQ